MILAFDTHYTQNQAKTVCVAFENWLDAEPHEIFTEITKTIADYEPGKFYKRELSCILSLLKKIDYKDIDAIVVDGFVYLDDENKLGLGGYLYNELDQKIPVIGVAKKNFHLIDKNRIAILRGNSQNPLFVTAAGMDLEKAADLVQKMHGAFRMPTLLKELDRLTKV